MARCSSVVIRPLRVMTRALNTSGYRLSCKKPRPLTRLMSSGDSFFSSIWFSPYSWATPRNCTVLPLFFFDGLIIAAIFRGRNCFRQRNRRHREIFPWRRLCLFSFPPAEHGHSSEPSSVPRTDPAAWALRRNSPGRNRSPRPSAAPPAAGFPRPRPRFQDPADDP